MYFFLLPPCFGIVSWAAFPSSQDYTMAGQLLSHSLSPHCTLVLLFPSLVPSHLDAHGFPRFQIGVGPHSFCIPLTLSHLYKQALQHSLSEPSGQRIFFARTLSNQGSPRISRVYSVEKDKTAINLAVPKSANQFVITVQVVISQAILVR